MDVASELASVLAELGRADTKAAALLGLAGAAAGVAATAASFGAPRLPVAAQVTVWLAVLLLVLSVAVLLYAIRPSLPRRGAGTGWVAYARLSPDVLAAQSADDYERQRRAELVAMSRLALNKHQTIQIAVDILLLALAVALLSIVLIVRGGA